MGSDQGRSYWSKKQFTVGYSAYMLSEALGSSNKSRLESIDLLRGVVMVLMALDHARDFLGFQSVNPTDLAKASAGLFLTRLVTHICAPVFFLLVGVGASLSLRRQSRAALSRFLFTRGLWLIFLEVTVVRFAMQFNVDYHLTMLFVIWALGWAMITLAVLVFLPRWVICTFGVVLIAIHNLADVADASFFGRFAPVWTVLHQPGVLFSAGGHVVFVAYPLIPLVGVTAAGFVLGKVYEWDTERRGRFLLWLALGLITAFVFLRALNDYGDAAPWVHQRSALLTVCSFFNTTKYPPSLLFLLMTLGPALLLLLAFDGATAGWMRPVLTYGRVPLLYYVLHMASLHLLAVAICLMRFGNVHWMFESRDLGEYPFHAPPGWGLGLAGVYLCWVFAVVSLYPVCAWFAALKQRRKEAWLSYL